MPSPSSEAMSEPTSSTPPSPAKPLSGEVIGLAVIVLGMMSLATWDQWAIWSTKEDYTFGYLVPVFSLYVAWERWANLRPLLTGESVPVGAPSAGWLKLTARTLTMLCLVVFALGAAWRAIFGTGTVATLAIAAGLMGCFLGFAFLSARGADGAEPSARSRWTALGLCFFPAAIWLVSGPFLYLVDNQIKGPLLEFVTEVVAGLLRISGNSVLVRGNILAFPNGAQVGIADACSGIRSLSSCIFVGAFLGALWIEGRFPGALIRRTLMIFVSAVAAIVLNIVRNTYLALHAQANGSHSLDRDFSGLEPGQAGFSSLGTVHDLAGNVAMGLTFLALIAFVPLINRLGSSRQR